MINNEIETNLWVEKYRPKTIDDCVLPKALKNQLNRYVNAGEIQNLMLCGTQGSGKTTVARALCNELGCDSIIINASLETGIDTVRSSITAFASTVSMSNDKPKIVILDEFDAASPQFMLAMRGFVESYHDNCRFIFTCNFKNKIIKAIHSRCSVVDFSFSNAETKSMSIGMFKRCVQILDENGIEYEKAVIAAMINKYFPDFRRILNELQRFSIGGQIDTTALASSFTDIFSELVGYLAKKDFKSMRSWVEEHSDVSSDQIFYEFYLRLEDKYLTAECVPQALLIIADYMYKHYFVSSESINISAMMTEIMGSCKFRSEFC